MPTPDLMLDASTRLLVVSPHPDDESLAAGVLIQRVLAAGGRVDVLLLTDGDDNPWPQRWMERRLVIDAAARKRWGVRRRAEVEGALATLGLSADSLHALGWHDMGVTTELRQRHGKSVDAIGRLLESIRPDLIVLPSLKDTHPDHSAGHVLARLALARKGMAARVLTFHVHGKTPDPVTLVLPHDAALQSAKRQAVLAHVSQVTLSRRRMLALAGRPEAFASLVAQKANRRLVLPWRPSAWWQKRLRLIAADDLGVRDMAWHEAPLERVGEDWVLLLRDAPGPSFVKLTADIASPWIFDHFGWVEGQG
ncbi:LmbE family N-acetylglucosaminyl deacetylase [Luteibacter sp. Sphag1AF]|uniref:PIG-L deacetylase family protein n=1 Tax=Luteibacter sp. Sphag1AF TaxID=2587031 RepID=UPI0017C9F24F|nr:PIG-L family deacetylase [Luteibacter sp. Sphag1AF]MBB3226838.1 LmbE family N-acetylglucosaminyl deacetylase [Luteibacter sp. Sphag1AF]